MAKKKGGKGKMGSLASVLTTGGSQVDDTKSMSRGPHTLKVGNEGFKKKKGMK
jgi:hypothetical protein